MTNEIQTQNQNEISVTEGKEVFRETDNYTIYKLANGKYEKVMKYKRVFSHIPQTREEEIKLYNIFNTQDNPNVTPFADMRDKEIEIHEFYTNPYESFNEETGETDNGVNTTIFDGSHYYSTSSKTVYYSLLNFFEQFGYPNTEGYEPVRIKVTGTRRENGVQIGVEFLTE